MKKVTTLKNLIRKSLLEYGIEESSLQEQEIKEVRCNPEELQEVLSIIESSRDFSITLSKKNPNYVLVKDAKRKGSCVVKRNDIFKI
jgi:hypothetical protein